MDGLSGRRFEQLYSESAKMIKANEIWEEYNKIPMGACPSLIDGEIQDILHYVDDIYILGGRNDRIALCYLCCVIWLKSLGVKWKK